MSTATATPVVLDANALDAVLVDASAVSEQSLLSDFSVDDADVAILLISIDAAPAARGASFSPGQVVYAVVKNTTGAPIAAQLTTVFEPVGAAPPA